MSFKKLNLFNYWNERGLDNIKPLSIKYGEYPEGWNPVEMIRKYIASEGKKVVELGCGYGRLCSAFDPENYLGLDINKNAINKANGSYPEYRFQAVGKDVEYPISDLYFAYTVFLHIDDSSAFDILKRVSSKTDAIVIAEILSRKNALYRKYLKYKSQVSEHPYFPRTRDEYSQILDAVGFDFVEEVKRPYRFYQGEEISFLSYVRKQKPPEILKEFPGSLQENSSLKYDGIFDDGWMTGKLSLELSRGKSSNIFVFDALIPEINGVGGANITISVNSETVFAEKVNSGEFRLSVPMKLPNDLNTIAVKMHPTRSLPTPDGRRIGALIRRIGFVDGN